MLSHMQRVHNERQLSIKYRRLDEKTGLLCYVSKHFNIPCRDLTTTTYIDNAKGVIRRKRSQEPANEIDSQSKAECDSMESN